MRFTEHFTYSLGEYRDVYEKHLKDLENRGIIKVRKWPISTKEMHKQIQAAGKHSMEIIRNAEECSLDVTDDFDSECNWWFSQVKHIQFSSSIFEEDLDENFFIKPTENPRLEVTYKNNLIVLNDVFSLHKNNPDSENGLVFQYLFNHPNKSVEIKTIETEIRFGLTKRLANTINDWGFKGALAKLFFEHSKSKIIFFNPISETRYTVFGQPKIEIELKSSEPKRRRKS